MASTQRFTLASLIAVLLSLVVWTGIYGRIGDVAIRFDKDLLYLYLCGAEYGGQASHDQQDKLVEHLVAASAHEHYVYRAKMRAAYCDNYPYTSLSMYFAGQVQRSLGMTDPAKDFAEFLFVSLRWGMVLSGALLGGLCLLIAFWAARGPLVLPLFGAIALAALFYLAVPPPDISWSLYQQTPAPPAPIVSLHRTFGLGLYTWINPTGAFSPFSVFPRSLCAMLAFAAYALRWSGRGGLAYWAPIAVSFVHQSEAPILLGVMIACDVVHQPKALLRPACFVPIVVTVALTALRERMFSIMGFSWVTAAIVLAVLIGLIVLAFTVPRIRSAVTSTWSLIDRLRVRWFAGLSLPASDTIVIVVGWVAVVILCYVVSRHDYVYRVGYLWSELFPRYIGLFQLPVFAGLIYAVWPWVLAKRPTATREALAVLSCLMFVIAIIEWKGPWTPTADIVAKSRTYEQEVLQQRYTPEEASFSKIETPWYYLMLRHAYLGGKGLDQYFSKS
ncbi:hypothetical protein AYJ54_29690 [Bradyrhizobium centrolobii]|uniref:Glycosyltransferase RgtA/B/C/D-like domain-containing protein n=1 Tax=Bradyrhizobium centrolobii TaxID=1505087 RepID=A0A176YAB2_9BRAD|nr:hypothetical protein AYJ54_29690 [Bradyrhizobium centrolobii]